LAKKFEVGDIVYEKKKGVQTLYEVVAIYPMETNDRYFKIKRINNFEYFDIYTKEPYFCATSFYRPVFWILKREVIIEKCQ